MLSKVLTFIETKLFTSLIQQYLADDEYAPCSRLSLESLMLAT